MLDTVHNSICHHCNTPMPTTLAVTATVDGASRQFCCHGCLGANQLISALHLESFYDYRDKCQNDGSSATASEPSKQWDEVELAIENLSDGSRAMRLLIPDIRCAACVWLLEKTLEKQSGVLDFQLSLAKRRLRVRFDETLEGSAIVELIQRLGYSPAPDHAGSARQNLETEKRDMLTRLGVAGLGMMPVMMLAMPSYFAGPATAANLVSELDVLYEALFRWASLALSIPVVFYSAAPFHRGAYVALKSRTLSMDFPVSLAILAAWFLSVYNTFSLGATVYYDTACMFAFFLLIGRYVELLSQQHFQNNEDSLLHLLPSSVIRLHYENGSASRETITAAQIQGNDILFVPAGSAIPADGVVLEGHSSVSDAAFTGEALPSVRGPGARVLAGASNHDADLIIRASSAADGFLIAQIRTLYEEASAYRPRWSQLADHAARWFIVLVLGLAFGAGAFWYFAGSANYIVIALTVLVVSCPCALSLATPVASTVATTALRRKGLLIRDGAFLERLASISAVVFDKTGTLTQSRLQLISATTLGPYDEQQCLALASALEQHSKHPIAQAFTSASNLLAHNVQCSPEGVAGDIDGRHYRIGKASFALPSDNTLQAPERDGLWVLLATQDTPLAWFRLQDSVREDAKELIATLKAAGLKTLILSGDSSQEGREIARSLGVDVHHLGLSPEDKIANVRALAQEHRVLMVGDGVNDAGAMAAATCSIAIAPRDLVVQQSADATLLHPALSLISTSLKFSQRCRRIIRQNIIWSLAYNFSAIPLALMGLLPPWLAALGMSSSSILVVLNAKRLRHMEE